MVNNFRLIFIASLLLSLNTTKQTGTGAAELGAPQGFCKENTHAPTLYSSATGVSIRAYVCGEKNTQTDVMREHRWYDGEVL
jgi:hypothetical protein